MKIVSENPFFGKTYFYIICTRGAYDLGNPGNLVTCPAGELFYLDLATKGRIQ